MLCDKNYYTSVWFFTSYLQKNDLFSSSVVLRGRKKPSSALRYSVKTNQRCKQREIDKLPALYFMLWFVTSQMTSHDTLDENKLFFCK